MKRINNQVVRWLQSERCIWFIIAFFIVESAWIALSGRYPMAFDEDFHLGIIRIYAHHLSPFFAHQPADANAFGAVARDPSYLYHYLMSFPYRLIAMLTSSTYVQVIALRFIDIAFFAAGIWLLSRLLATTRAPKHWCNLVLFFFALIPVVPQLAAQINYDNLFIPLVALSLLLTITIGQRLERTGKLAIPELLGLIILCMLTSLVKYAFLPIFLAIVGYLLWRIIAQLRTAKVRWWPWLQASYRASNRLILMLGVLGVLGSGGLFFERYGINLIRYHTPIPACDKVLSIPECTAYGPWDRDYLYKQVKTKVNPNQFKFTGDWLYGLFERSFFAVNGPQSNFATQPALPVIALTAAAFGGGGIILFLWYRKPIMQSTRHLGFLLTVSAVYAAVLWGQNYTDYLKVGQPVAINGRYTFPIIVPVLLAVALGYRQLLRNYQTVRNGVMALFFAVIITQGGGTMTFILRSDASWYWPNNQLVEDANSFMHRAGELLVVN